MRYLKKFESNKIRMPRKCSGEEAIQKMNVHKLEEWTLEEKKWLELTMQKKFEKFEILPKGAIIRNSNHNIFINKIQDNWFTIIISYSRENLRMNDNDLGYRRNGDQFYIADEFIEVQNFLQSIS